MSIRIGLCGTPWDYKDSLIPKVIELVAGEIIWEDPCKADLVIVGPFDCALNKTKKNLVPKLFRSHDHKLSYLSDLSCVTLFHTSENIRPDKFRTDFSISFDETPHNSKNMRFPYWMEFVDWSNQGIKGQANPRFGCLLDQNALLRPLGNQLSKRAFKAAFFTSHLVEPRKELYALTKQYIDVDGFGAAFDSNIKNHAQSGIVKKQVLSDYVFNLCPENSMHPGYNTEKIPESFMSGCIPITWTVPGKNTDFNSKAFINLALDEDLDLLIRISKKMTSIKSERFLDVALLENKKTLLPLIGFVEKILKENL